jgi:hypothetical protein
MEQAEERREVGLVERAVGPGRARCKEAGETRACRTPDLDWLEFIEASEHIVLRVLHEGRSLLRALRDDACRRLLRASNVEVRLEICNLEAGHLARRGASKDVHAVGTIHVSFDPVAGLEKQCHSSPVLSFTLDPVRFP